MINSLHESEAFQRQCPILVGACSKPNLDSETTCMGSQCMAWVWTTKPREGFYTRPGVRPDGPGDWRLVLKRPERWVWTRALHPSQMKGVCGMVKREVTVLYEQTYTQVLEGPWEGDTIPHED